MSVLVTGSLGFIGRRLMDALLKEGYTVKGVDQQSSFFQLSCEEFKKVKDYMLVYDICSKDGMDLLVESMTDVDAVIHLAALAAPRIAESKPDETFRVNVYGTYNVLKVAKKLKAKRVVFASSAHVYGISPKYIPTDESHPLALHDTYTSSKILGERLCQLFYENHNLPYIALRQFNGYGPGQSLDYFIPATINQALQHSRIVLRGRRVTKDFVYVDDMVEAMIAAVESDFVGALNVGTGAETSLETVATFIANKLDVPLEFADSEDKGPTRMCCDPSRMERNLGWKAKTTLTEGLSKTIEWMKQNNG